MDYILAIDQGTTATTVLVMDQKGTIVGEASLEYPQHYPLPSFVEHVGDEIKRSVELACKNALEIAKISPTKIAGIGITNQRETIALFEANGHCLRPFIVWQCRRSSDICEEIKNKNLGPFLHQKTGLHLDPYFSASKLLWLFRDDPSLLKRAQKKEFLFGTIDTFLCHWLSGGALHITDVTNASRTMLMDISLCRWSNECLDIFSVPQTILPTIVKNIGPYGHTKGLNFLPDGIPIAAMAGDQQAALFGQNCFNQGDAKATYGTGCFILFNTGEDLVFSKHGLISSVAYQIRDDPIYCLEGSAFIAGAAVQFLRDNLKMINSSDEIEALAQTVDDNGGVVFVPALCGLGAPHWRPNARGLFSGLTRATTRGHIARAVLEGIALQNTDIIAAMTQDAQKIALLKVDGGAAKNDLLMQLQADLLGVKCIRPISKQKTAIGAAYLAGLALGIFKDLETLKNIHERQDVFNPRPDRSYTNELINNYREALKKA
jgi:glycerol kinase